MQHSYHIATQQGKEGPHDLVTIMRRIRAGKITHDTPIYIGDAAEAAPAGQIADIAFLFDQPDEEPMQAERTRFSLKALIVDAWHFTLEHNVMTVFAGGLLLISFLLGNLLVNLFGIITGGLLAWCVFVMLHNMYLLFFIRLYRGQTAGSDFVNRQMAPVLPTLLLAFLVLALMMGGGFLLLLIPGIVVAVLYIFVPFLILDRRYRLVEAMQASRLLLQKHHRKNIGVIAALVALHSLCLLLIIPIPLTLPMFAAMLSHIYEELSVA